MTTYSNAGLRRIAPLFDEVDAGRLTLPEPIDRLRTAHRSLAVQLDAMAVPAQPDSVVYELTDRILADAENRAPLPEVDEIAATRARTEAGEILYTAAHAAAASLEERLAGAVHGRADQLIADTLAPPFAKLLDDLHRVASTLHGHDLDPVVVLSAPDRVRKARIELDTIAGRYDTLRRIQAALSPYSAVALDIDGVFTEMSDRLDHLPLANFISKPRPPWPEDQSLRLLWLVEHDCKLWMPTGPQRDEAYRVALPDSPAVKGRHPLAHIT